ncbi:uncharacterized protein FOBCDRAFT_253733 [Fusarium oxysporum Fo47]|uniref:uncharacterized protein n=1 Tax=Fusarium oxysporum Fo47 TaxID=660027 RepID=UPI002869CBAF|nr:uncharacterized protein FOBCDRAFT_253733 [Fusarium oxysporum Fo47]QKD61058.2 hypothetical protein FOBCDRAFT_253733 [Fusarium oxysporum Fo47]
MSYWTSSLCLFLHLYPSLETSDHSSRAQSIMLTGFEALGAVSAVLQVVSFATDVAVACKNAYDGATTSEDDLHRHAKQMSEAVNRVHTRCEQMKNANSKFASPKLQNIAKECKDAADKLEAEVRCVTKLQAQGDILRSVRKAFRASKHQKGRQALQESLLMYQQVVKIELTSHLCSQSDAIHFQQDASFQKMDNDVKFLINRLAEGITDVKDLVKQEHATTRNAFAKEGARVEAAINSHTDSQVLELRTTAETERKCEVFLQSLKTPRMNQRYNDVMDSRDASFKQVFASYEDMRAMFYEDSEHSDDSGDKDGLNKDNDQDDGGDSESCQSSETIRDLDCISHLDEIHHSWDCFNSWLQSDNKLFYIRGKPGSGKSTLVKFILDQDQTRDLVRRWNPDAIIISHFFWKIGSEEQNGIKGLWCSLLYQRLKYQQDLILRTLQRYNHLSLHSDYHDWSVEDLEAVWAYVATFDGPRMCIFIDGLDEFQHKDGFSKLSQTIKYISEFPETKLCVSTRHEAHIKRWLETEKAAGILLENLTRFDMLAFVQKETHHLLPNSHISSESFNRLRRQLVDKAQGVFLWLHLATRSIIEGIENHDSESMLFKRLEETPGDLENLYADMWQRLNAKSTVYQETARRYFRYVLHGSHICIESYSWWYFTSLPLTLQIACAENHELQEKLLGGTSIMELSEILRICNETKASIHKRCAGLLEIHQMGVSFEKIGDNSAAFNEIFGEVAFIHRTAHDFLTDTEVGRGILGCETLDKFPSQQGLLKGLVCAVIILASERALACKMDVVIRQITNFAERWESNGLQLATEMLDVIQPLYDKHVLRSDIWPWVPRLPFLSYLVNNDLFEDFIVSRLTRESSTDLATSILREAWNPKNDVELPQRIFDTLNTFGADPHEHGVLSGMPELVVFFRSGTAFTNLLTTFIMSTQTDHEDETLLTPMRSKVLYPDEACQTLEMAIHMAKTCQNLNAAVALFASLSEAGNMVILPFDESNLVVFEVNLQFLLLYLLSVLGTVLAESELTGPRVQDVMSKIDSPAAKLRYFLGPKAIENTLKQDISSSPKFKRILSPTASLPRNVLESLFSRPFTIENYIRDLEIEEVDAENVVASLAKENLGICTSEDAGISPCLEYLGSLRMFATSSGKLFPLTIGQLEEAAASRESLEDHR